LSLVGLMALLSLLFSALLSIPLPHLAYFLLRSTLHAPHSIPSRASITCYIVEIISRRRWHSCHKYDLDGRHVAREVVEEEE